jgi:hypothetical protein
MFQPQAVQIEWYKDNRVYIRTAMPFGTRLNLKPFEVFEVHFPTAPVWIWEMKKEGEET